MKYFVWLLLKDRLPVRDRLQRFRVIQDMGNVCPICLEAKEESRHLFIHFGLVYTFWVRVAKTWDMNFVWVGDVATSFDILHYTLPKGPKSFIWQVGFTAPVWVI